MFTNIASERTVIIKNPTDKELSWAWDGDLYILNPHSEEKMPFWLGQHLFKHLSKQGLILDESEKMVCGTCSKEFDTRRELGAHSLIHRKDKE